MAAMGPIVLPTGTSLHLDLSRKSGLGSWSRLRGRTLPPATAPVLLQQAKGRQHSSKGHGSMRSRARMETAAAAAAGAAAEAAEAATAMAAVGAVAAPSSRAAAGAPAASTAGESPSFLQHIADQGLPVPLRRQEVRTVQVNVGLYCNQACAHCHVDSSPLRTEMMDRATAARVVHLVASCPSVRCMDLTGGAPELNPQFRYLVSEAVSMGKEVIDRCNLTVLFEPGQEDLAEFLAENRVKVVASLPCYSMANVDKQRGKGVFDLSIQALQLLNSLGYGKPGSGLSLDLVYNPVGLSLPPQQDKLEATYKKELMEAFGIEFNSLFTITNMPIKRFASFLRRQGQLEEYMNLLVSAFNPATVDSVMCRSLVSIQWDGTIYDCDFNQQLDLPLPSHSLSLSHSGSNPPTPSRTTRRTSVFDILSLNQLVNQPIATAPHCFGCTAGHGSSCTGATA